METQSTSSKEQQTNPSDGLIRLQWAFLVITTCLIIVAMVMPMMFFLILYTFTKNPYTSIPSAIVPSAIVVGLGFALRHMAIRIFPKGPDELRIDEIKAKHIQPNELTKKRRNFSGTSEATKRLSKRHQRYLL